MNKELTKAIDSWVNSYQSENTRIKYTQALDDFSTMVFNKKPSQLTQEDLVGISYSATVNKFVEPLRGSGIKDSTIKLSLTAVRQFMKVLRRDKVFDGVDYNYINEDCLTVNLKNNDVNHHEALSLEELKDMKRWFKEKKYRSSDILLGEKYAMLVDFMYSTVVRVDATMNITWDDFTLLKSPHGGSFAILKVIDKGHKLNEKPLHREYYDKLKALFYKGDPHGKVFEDLTKDSLRRYFKQYSEVLGRRVSPHSLKAGAATTLYAETHDIILVRDFCDHDSVTTTESYIRRSDNPNLTGSAIRTANFDYDKLNDLSKEDLLRLVKNRLEIKNTIYIDALDQGLFN